MTVDEDWSSAEDAQLRAFLRAGVSWDDIAETLLRSTVEVQTRAVHLDRLDHLVTTAAPTVTPAPAPVKTETQESSAITTGPGKGGNGVGRSWSVYSRGVCDICGKGIEWDDGPRRRYCSSGCAEEANRRRAAARYRALRDAAAAPTPAPAPEPAPEPPAARKGACAAHLDAAGCCLRSRHRGEHLTDTGWIFSRDGKVRWRDIGDLYLMMALNNDMVAPQPPAGR